MKLSVHSRGWVWTGFLLLAACCMVKAADNTSVPSTAPSTTKGALPSDNTTSTSPPVQGNATTTSVPVVSNSSNATNPTPAPASTAAASTSSTAKTQGTAVTNATTTVVTNKTTVKTTAVTAASASPVTSSMSSSLQKTSGFDLGSFIGGIVLTVGLLAAVYFGCRFYNSKRGVRYRTIDEHEAII